MSDPVNRPLVEFIAHARTKGMDHTTIRMLLLAEGWKEKEIARAMAEHGLDLTVPTPPDIGGAREAFLHLVMFAALYTAVIAAISLTFSLIDAVMPDAAAPLMAAEFRRVQLRWAIAALVVSFPSDLLARQLLGETLRTPDRARSPIRRWLTDLTLFAAAVAVGVDAMTLVYRLLSGDVTLRFAAKVAAVLVLAGGPFVLLRLVAPVRRGTRAFVPAPVVRPGRHRRCGGAGRRRPRRHRHAVGGARRAD